MSSSFPMFVGIAGVIIIFCLIIAAYTPVMGSAANDAITNDVANSSHNNSYKTGTAVAVGFMGLDQTIIGLLVILAIVIAFLMIFVFR